VAAGPTARNAAAADCKGPVTGTDLNRPLSKWYIRQVEGYNGVSR
jgi:hypothetical protein